MSTFENSLGENLKHLLKEWDYEKNINIDPFNIYKYSKIKVWCKCEKGHSWPAIIHNRSKNNGTGCLECNKGSNSSFAEHSVYFYL